MHFDDDGESKEHSRLETTPSYIHPVPSTSFAEQCLFYMKCAAKTYTNGY